MMEIVIVRRMTILVIMMMLMTMAAVRLFSFCAPWAY